MRSDPRAGLGLKAAAWGAIAFLHIPLALIILYAFSAEDKSYVFPPPALTAQWFGVAWQREDVWAAVRLSFEVAAWSTAIAIVLGALAAAALEGAIACHREYADAHFHLARLLDEEGRSDEATEHWREFLKLAPESPWHDEARARLGLSGA